jgi:hypothetical protein
VVAMMTLRQAQAEIMRHSMSTFCTEEKSMAQGGTGVIVPGCPSCRLRLQTMNQFMAHLAEDVLPEIFRMREPGEDG